MSAVIPRIAVTGPLALLDIDEEGVAKITCSAGTVFGGAAAKDPSIQAVCCNALSIEQAG